MSIEVFFETKGYAEKIAEFKNEEIYIRCLPVLEKAKEEYGFLFITEQEMENDYEIYHDTFTSAVNSAKEFAENSGYQINSDEFIDNIGLGNAKPTPGNTNRYSIHLYKKGQIQKECLQVQIFNRGTKRNEFELNCYVL